jgi:hypothetical protein
MSQFVRLNTNGVMDKDTDSQFLREGNYEDANDIRHRSLVGSENQAIVPVVGNALAVTIPNTTITGRVYRVFIDISSGAGSGFLYYKDSASNAIAAANLSLSYSTLANYYTALTNNSTGLFNDIVASPANPFQFTALTITSVTSPPTTGYFDVSLDQLTDLEYLLWQVGDLFDIQLLTEYINSVKSFKVIGSEELDGDVFVWSVTDRIFDTSSRTISEIGVITYNEGANTYAYKRLIRSKLLDFDPNYRVQAQVEKTNIDQVNLYWTDAFNKPRTIRIKGAYATDMALRAYGGNYDLDYIENQTSFVLPNTSAVISITSVNEGGGAVTAGNKRYMGRFLTDDLVPTDFIFATNPISIYSAPANVPSEILGNIAGDTTNKSVTCQLTNIPSGVYKYFEFVAIEYAGGGFSAKILERVSLSQSQTDITLEHTNRGQLNQTLSNAELLSVTTKFERVQTMKIFTNRMVFSNAKEQVDYNLDDWASSIAHTLEYKEIPAIGKLFPNVLSGKSAYVNMNYAEYLNPLNTYNYTGYMMNDTYRFGVQVQWKDTGKWSQAYWVDDIRFDTLANNVIGPPITIGGVTYPTRRTANNITTNLTNADNSLAYVYYPKFGNINLNYVVSGTGKLLFELISAFRFTRAERIPEVLATGLVLPGTRWVTDSDTVMPYTRFSSVASTYPNSFGQSTAAAGPISQIGGLDESNFAYFYSPDHLYSVTTYDFFASDKLLVLNKTNSNSQLFGNTNGDYFSTYEDTNGYYTAANQAYVTFGIDEGRRFEYGQQLASYGSRPVNNNEKITTGAQDITGHHVPCHVLRLDAKLTQAGKIPAGASTVFSGYYAQIFRNKGANLKYSKNKYETIYNSTGHIRNLIDGENGVLVESVFGGDVFNQKTHLQLRRTSLKANRWGFGYLTSIYSQNVGNIQMFNRLDYDESATGAGWVFPQYEDKQAYEANYFFLGSASGQTALKGSSAAGLFNTIEQWPEIDGQRNYDLGYNAKDGTISDTGFDSSITYSGERPSTIFWSQKKQIDSTQDNYRVFKPIDFADLDQTQGSISTHEIVNGNLYTFQNKSVQRQYFNDATTINSASGSDIVIGAGSILGAPGIELTSIGCDKKWSVIKGRSTSGKDNIYWFNDQLRKIARLGADGVNVISDRGFSSYLHQKANFLRDKYQQIGGEGVHGVWNDKYNELILTFKAVTTKAIEYPDAGTYVIGDMVKNTSPGAPRQSSGLSYVYVAKINFTVSSDDFEPGVGAAWTTYWNQLSVSTNPELFTLFTTVYDEIKNGFITFHSYYPNIYMPFLNTFYSTKPNDEKLVYVHDRGDEMNYYGEANNGTITSVMNYDLNLSKNYEAIQVVSGTNPFRLDFTTRDHVSFLTQGELDELEDYFYGPIKNDSTGTGVNSGDTTRLWGRYLKIKFTFFAGAAQKLLNYVVKYRPNHRLYRK